MVCPIYTSQQVLALQIIALSGSCVSLVAFTLICIWEYRARKTHAMKFRHRLVLVLVFADFIKALCIMMYSAFILEHGNNRVPPVFVGLIGFCSAWAIESSDFSVLILAVYTSIIILKPHRVEAFKRSKRYIFAFMTGLPLIMAAIGFTNPRRYTTVGYRGFVPKIFYSYLPVAPLWPALLLAWIPRYLIMITIITLYGIIYIHVKRELQNLSKTLNYNPALSEVNSHISSASLNIFQHIKRKFSHSISFLPFIEPPKPVVVRTSFENDSSQQWQDLANEINQTNLDKFNKRRNTVEHQMSYIFVYPIAYMFNWLGPFLQQIVQYYSITHVDPKVNILSSPTQCFETETQVGTGIWRARGVFWISVISATLLPLNCFVVATIYFFKEYGFTASQQRAAALLDSQHNDNERPVTTRHTHPRKKSSTKFHFVTKVVAFPRATRRRSVTSATTIDHLEHYRRRHREKDTENVADAPASIPEPFLGPGQVYYNQVLDDEFARYGGRKGPRGVNNNNDDGDGDYDDDDDDTTRGHSMNSTNYLLNNWQFSDNHNQPSTGGARRDSDDLSELTEPTSKESSVFDLLGFLGSK